ncbi:MAG: hypothetical protein ACE5GQ_11725 [Nitrospinales bacterium]
MEVVFVWSALALGVGCVCLVGFLIFKGYGLVKVLGSNRSRLRELKKLQSDLEADPLERKAAGVALGRCEALQSKWILGESDARFLENTHRLIDEVARVYHPHAPVPAAEARIGRLLRAFLDLKSRLDALMKGRGIFSMTQFRVRHVVTLSRAWNKKKEWEASSAGMALKKYKFYFLVKWVYTLFRCLDISFWAMKMFVYIIHDIVFKALLIRWYLMVADLAREVYMDQEKEAEVQPEAIMEELEGMPETEADESGLPEGVKVIVDASRKEILFNPWALEWRRTRDIYRRLVEDIAGYHHPRAASPLYEAKVFDLLAGLARLAEETASLQSYPVINKALDLRISHVLWVKDAADILRDNQLLNWLGKYNLHHVVKYSSLIFKAVSKRHPGLIFKDFAFTLAREGGKRWVYLFFHRKIAAEAHMIYKAKS